MRVLGPSALIRVCCAWPVCYRYTCPPRPCPRSIYIFINFCLVIGRYRMSHDRWHAFNQSEVLNAVQNSVVFPFTGVRCTQRASIGYWQYWILSTPYTRKGKQLPQAERGTCQRTTSGLTASHLAKTPSPP